MVHSRQKLSPARSKKYRQRYKRRTVSLGTDGAEPKDVCRPCRAGIASVSAARATSVCHRDFIRSRHRSRLRNDVKKCLLPLACTNGYIMCTKDGQISSKSRRASLAFAPLTKNHRPSENTDVIASHQSKLDRVGKEEVIFRQHLFNLSCGDGEHCGVNAGVKTDMPEHHIYVALAENFVRIGTRKVLCTQKRSVSR